MDCIINLLAKSAETVLADLIVDYADRDYAAVVVNIGVTAA